MCYFNSQRIILSESKKQNVITPGKDVFCGKQLSVGFLLNRSLFID